MTRAATQSEQFDHNRDLAKHEMTSREIVAELDRIEREMREAATKGQNACKEAMTVIENLMNDLGIPMAKGTTDAQA
jgi:hypothetical protein